MGCEQLWDGVQCGRYTGVHMHEGTNSLLPAKYVSSWAHCLIGHPARKSSLIGEPRCDLLSLLGPHTAAAELSSRCASNEEMDLTTSQTKGVNAEVHSNYAD